MSQNMETIASFYQDSKKRFVMFTTEDPNLTVQSVAHVLSPDEFNGLRVALDIQERDDNGRLIIGVEKVEKFAKGEKK